MEYKKYDCDSYNIHTIKTDKFKTVRMEIIFSREVIKEELPVFTFLSDILTDCSKNYQRRKDMAIKLEELYKTIFYGVTSKTGNLLTISFVLEFISPDYINENGYLKDVVSLPFKVINNPRVKNKEFDLTNFNIVKKRLLEEIESVKESSDKLAIMNSLKAMDEKSPSSFKVYGTKEDIENITPASLYKAYENLFNHSNCDIFVIGNANMDEIAKIIKANFVNHVIKLKTPRLLVLNKLRKKTLKVTEPSPFLQSTLVMIYNIKDLSKKDKDTSFHVFNYLFGSGGLNAELYRVLRSEESLCYAVRSLYLKNDELLLIEVSLDKSNVSKAEKLITKTLNNFIKKGVNEETLNLAKKNLVISLKMASDNNVALLNNYVFHVFDNLPLIDERIEMINKVEITDLIKCAKSLVLNTVYVQDAGDDNERN